MPATRAHKSSPMPAYSVSAVRGQHQRPIVSNEVIEISSDDEIATPVRRTPRTVRPLLEELREASTWICIFISVSTLSCMI